MEGTTSAAVPRGELRVEAESLDPQRLELVKHEWQQLEEVSPNATPYVGFDWLHAWAQIYEPRRLAVVRVTDSRDKPVALGLLDTSSRTRWSFAGSPVTSDRRLLCAKGSEAAAWAAFGSWLLETPRAWASLDGEGAGPAVATLPRVRLDPVSFFRFDLPDSFEAYLANRPSETRKRFRQRLRYLERADGRVSEAVSSEHAVHDLIRLHLDRARSKGERHPQMDGRLEAMLVLLAADRTLVATEVRTRDELLGVAVHCDYHGTRYFYNGGIREAGSQLSPGVLLELDAVRTAIDRGLGRFDLGPGYYSYKHELGGVPVARYTFMSASPTPRGTTAWVRHTVHRHLCPRAGRERLRRLVRRR